MGNDGVKKMCGIDIGGTKVRWIIVERRGGVRNGAFGGNDLRIAAAHELPTPKHREAFENLLAYIFLSLHRRGIRNAGVSAAGTIVRNGIVSSHNLPLLRGLRFAPLAPRGMRIVAANDARCFALGEARAGASVRSGSRRRAQRSSPVLAVTLGTGVGRALIKNGAVTPIIKFEHAEPWEKEYQKKARLPAGPLAAFLAPRLASLARASGARTIVLGGGRLRTPGLFNALARELRQSGFRGRVFRSHFRENSAAMGAALLVM